MVNPADFDHVLLDNVATGRHRKGKPFNPGAKRKSIFDKAAEEAHHVIALKYESGFHPPFIDGTQWGLPIPPATRDGLSSMFAVMYHMAYFSPKAFGGGQFIC